MLDEQSGISKPSKGRTAIKGGSPIHHSTMRVDVEGHWPADNEKEIRKKISEQNLTEKEIIQMISGGKANNAEKESLVKILNEMQQGFIAATEENVKAGKSKEDIKDGDKLAKKLKINGMSIS